MFEDQTVFESPTLRSLGSPVVLGAGPVARAVVAALVVDGVEPVVVSRRGTAVPGARAVAADIADERALTDVIRGADAVFQCAQPAYHRWPQEFPALQRRVVDALRGSGAVLVAVENMYGYGPVTGPMTERTAMRATTRKGRVRAAMWQELEAAHASGDVATAAVRASDFLGPGTESAYGDRFVAPIVAGKSASVLGDPDTSHSVTYLPDLGRAMVLVARDPGAWGKPWHAPVAPAVTQRELAAMVAEAAGHPAPKVRRIGTAMLRLGGLFVRPIREMVEMAYEFEHDFVVDSSAFEQRYGATATPLSDAVRATVDAARR